MSTASYAYAEAVTPSDSVDLEHPSRGLWVGTTGDVSVEMAGGGTHVFSNVPSGTLLPIRVTRVNFSSTGASDIVALY